MRQQATLGVQHAAPSRLRPLASRFIHSARVAHLATADASGQPHVIPICFLFDGKSFYSPIDEKPKRTAPLNLQRLRNIQANPKVSLVIDRYDEDWRQLAYFLVFGTARLLKSGARHRRAVAGLRRKYSQYRTMKLDHRPIIWITVKHIRLWGNLAL